MRKIYDNPPLFIIPDIATIVTSSFVRALQQTLLGQTETLIFGRPAVEIDAINNALRNGFLELKVTSISVNGELIMPKTKGIGSVGEIIHVVGSRNEKVDIRIMDDRFPGITANVMKLIISRTMNSGNTVVLVDDMMSTVICLIRDYTITTRGDQEGVIDMSISLEVIPTLDQQRTLAGLVTAAINSISSSIVLQANKALRQRTRNDFSWIADFVSSLKEVRK